MQIPIEFPGVKRRIRSTDIKAIIEKIFGKSPRGKIQKPFSAWQIELTTRCPLMCKMCIRSESTDWQYQDMPLENFKKILPYLCDVETVVLEGWGESLLHKYLPECIRLVKEAGPKVGFVTSGMGLTEDRVSELIEAGLDFAGFSISGTARKTHDSIRVNSHLDQVLDSIRLFREEKKHRGISRPNLHIVYLMLKDNIMEVPSVPLLAKQAGIEEVLLINECYIVNAWQESEMIFCRDGSDSEYEKIVKQAESNARKLRIKLKRPYLTAVDVPVCAENPLRNLYISVDGNVSPCVYLYPPLPSPLNRIFCGKEHTVDKLSFGNIFKDTFPSIWNRQEYVRFRQRFIEREKNFKELYSSIWDHSKIKQSVTEYSADPPLSCKTCHKIIGI